MVQEDEVNRILAFGRGPESPPQCETPLHRIFESVAAAPNAPAVVAGETSLTYRELNLRANNLAHHLAGRGFAEGSIAAVALPRGPEAIVCFLAIRKAGGAYLPVDLRDPGDRIDCLLRLAKAQIVLTQSSLAASLPSSVRKGDVCFMD
jgi:non-ribosomal peptide synthetase component F